ncbi:hypothetical protein SPRG_12168 [Saprolegnia parasitica CBS 223.65]|uniref:Uncharacterized protein n=1 Tax=Saprolegnia parasitica (strain CBS 223.65) TaxID=695850 RepID=A0A067C888_SAPPC|nr:hypothetical protein SPRG_12168 [Saprolegnia parasitica CBS 223.65]KDO22741.1 hypothetical protein SPRG_12168 [Saprolegnia parasitica CBS 223.65]|eukprot:XP_012206529.1 hypothetical protein SPRG_12168 [Saprolegnia parasitica CBS 223.65]
MTGIPHAKATSPLDDYNVASTPSDETPTTPAPTTTSWTTKRTRIAIAIVALTGVVCVTLGAIFVFQTHVTNHATEIITNIQQSPGLKISLRAKRDTMTFNGKSTADVFVVPRGGAGSTLLFDALLTQVGPEITETYLLLDHKAYYATSKNGVVVSAECLDAGRVPPVQLMQTSLHESSVLDNYKVANVTIADCPDGKLLHVSFAGESFVFCNSKNNLLTHATGTDLDISVEYLSDPTLVPEMEIPVLPNGEPLTCAAVVADSVLPVAKSLMQTSSDVASYVAGYERSTVINKASCGCKMGKKKPCLFVHGVGETEAGPMTPTFPSGWGNIQEHAPCCSSVQFIHLETTNHRWDDASTQQDFCDAALRVSKATSTNGTKELGSMILVTFSMGNLIASSAVANNKCSIGKDVTWVSIAGPMQGSKTANLLANKCAAGGWGNAIIKYVLKQVGFCPVQQAYDSLKHQTTVGAHMQAKFVAAQAVRQKHVTRVLCGTNAVGLTSLTSAAIGVVGKMSQHDSPDYDGVVDFTSCAVGIDPRKFGTSAETSFHFKASINHLDASMRYGDGWWGCDRKPVKWFECAL